MVVTSYARFKEKVPGGTLDLKLRMQLLGGSFVEGQGTPNVLADRKPRGRLKKIPIPTASTSPASIYAEVEAPAQSSTLLLNHQSTAVKDVAEPTTESTTGNEPTAEDTIIVGTSTPAAVQSRSILSSALRTPVARGPKVTADKVEKRVAVRCSPRIQSQL